MVRICRRGLGSLILLVATASCGSYHSQQAEVLPTPRQPPSFQGQLTGPEIDSLMKDSFHGQGRVSWAFWEELVRHGQEPLVRESLSREAASDDLTRIPAQLALIVLGDSPEQRLSQMRGILESGSPHEARLTSDLVPIAFFRQRLSVYVPQLLVWCESDDETVRTTGLNAVYDFVSEPGVKATLLNACHDESDEVRATAAGLIGAVARDHRDCFTPSEIDSLVESLMQDSSSPIRQQACYIASLFPEESYLLVSLIAKLKEDTDPCVRLSALIGLASSSDRPLALGAIREALDDSDPHVRREADDILTKRRYQEWWPGRILLILASATLVFLLGLAVGARKRRLWHQVSI